MQHILGIYAIKAVATATNLSFPQGLWMPIILNCRKKLLSLPKADFPKDADGWNMGFCQLLIIHNAEACPIGSKMRKNRTVYRALCEKNGKLCIVESKKVVTYEDFVKYLVEFKVKHALYLDMGSGWNYAWFRDKDGKVNEIFPNSKYASNYKYRTNWITFYK